MFVHWGAKEERRGEINRMGVRESHQTLRQKAPCKSRVRAWIPPQTFMTFPSLPFQYKHISARCSCVHMRIQTYSYKLCEAWQITEPEASSDHSYIKQSIYSYWQWQSYTLKLHLINSASCHTLCFVHIPDRSNESICVAITLSCRKTSLLWSLVSIFSTLIFKLHDFDLLL